MKFAAEIAEDAEEIQTDRQARMNTVKSRHGMDDKREFIYLICHTDRFCRKSFIYWVLRDALAAAQKPIHKS